LSINLLTVKNVLISISVQ